MKPEILYTINYVFLSTLGYSEDEMFISRLTGYISGYDINANKEIPRVGIIHAKIYHVTSMIYCDSSPIKILYEDDEYELCDAILNFKNGFFKKSIINYKSEIGSDIIIIDSIEILPDYRGNGITKMIIYDLCLKYLSSVGFIILKISPLQFEELNESSWVMKMELGDLETDVKTAYTKLKKFFKTCGFTRLKGINILLYENKNIRL